MLSCAARTLNILKSTYMYKNENTMTTKHIKSAPPDFNSKILELRRARPPCRLLLDGLVQAVQVRVLVVLPGLQLAQPLPRSAWGPRRLRGSSAMDAFVPSCARGKNMGSLVTT